MSGSVIGGQKAHKTNIKRYGRNFYRRIGALGGMKSQGGGFSSVTHEQVSAYGRKGGQISKRPKR